MVEELAPYEHGTSIKENIHKKHEQTLIQYNMNWNLLRYIITDFDKNMCGADKKGLI